MLHRLEVILKPDLEDPEGKKALKGFHTAGFSKVNNIRTQQIYSIDSPQIKSTDQLANLAAALFVDPVLNTYTANQFNGDIVDFDWYVEVGFKAGVTDNAGKVAQENLELQLKEKFKGSESVAASTGYFITGSYTKTEINQAVDSVLLNDLIQRKTVIAKKDWEMQKGQLLIIPKPAGDQTVQVERLDCSSVEKIMELSQQRILALSAAEAEVILNWFNQDKVKQERIQNGLPEQPTDVELEAIAQTWSEHCKHKIFNATINYTDELGNVQTIKSLYKSFIQDATHRIREQLGENDWCLSVFKDNAGVIKFNDNYSVAFKVETHNSPSALDPYGGALTGIVGVNRDSFGTGMGAQLVANTDVFCFGPMDYEKLLPARLFHPTRVFEGVRLGVEHGGNHSGIPTVNGAIVFDECYVGKPLVFCGTASVMPAQHENQPGEDKKANPGDLIVMIGGRIGKDGIHGATFSSVVLDESSPVSAVQIGDPITQKRMFDFLWEAKKENLYSCITDNGAGGLSSSVGEMAEFSNGCKMHLDKAPLKYDGLQPWEILISEAQERMTVSVPIEKIQRFMALSEKLQVESTLLGEFTNTGLFECFYDNKPVAQLDMQFLHKGLPAMQLKAAWQPQEKIVTHLPEPTDMGDMLHQILARPNVCSKESVIRQYDHEVQGGSVIKPLTGVEADGPSDSGVIRPVLDTMEGVAISNGICPKYSTIDTYHMVACAIDEAIRNIIATGGSLEQIAGLDNFCWPDPVESDHTPDGQYKLAQLVRACQALYDYCLAFGVPCISGKDSMKNDANLDGQKISILPTLLFSAIGKINDVRKCVSSDVKQAGDLVYIVGETNDECGASEYYQQLGITEGLVPKVNAKVAKARYNRISQATEAQQIQSIHDCSDGGLAVTLAETAFGGGLGLDINIEKPFKQSGIPIDSFLFSESQSRFVITVKKEHQAAFETFMAGDSFYQVGLVREDPDLVINNHQELVLKENTLNLKKSWKKTLN
jgi:phosphoribosylformylglycinamidine synthase subunit PurSL